MNLINKKYGFSLIEIILSLSVILSIIVAIGYTYKIVEEKQKVRNTIDSILNVKKDMFILSAINSEMNDSIATLKDGNTFPENMKKNGKILNSWKGNFNIDKRNNSNEYYNIILYNIPKNSCINLISQSKKIYTRVENTSGKIAETKNIGSITDFCISNVDNDGIIFSNFYEGEGAFYTSVSTSTSYSISTSASNSIILSNSISQSNSVSASNSISLSNSISTSTSLSRSNSISTSTSIINSISNSISKSNSISLSNYISLSSSVSNSTSISNSISYSASVSNSISNSNSISTSNSVSFSRSISVSKSVSNSISTSISSSISNSISNSISLSNSVIGQNSLTPPSKDDPKWNESADFFMLGDRTSNHVPKDKQIKASYKCNTNPNDCYKRDNSEIVQINNEIYSTYQECEFYNNCTGNEYYTFKLYRYINGFINKNDYIWVKMGKFINEDYESENITYYFVYNLNVYNK